MHAKTLYTTILLLLITHSALAADSWQECLQLADDSARLACYDAYAKQLSAGEQAAMPTAEEQKAGFGMPAVSVADDIEEIHASIVRVQKKSRGKRVLTLDSGQVWEQVDSRTSPSFKDGDSIIIKRAAFGSFVLKPVDSNRTIRVRRLR